MQESNSNLKKNVTNLLILGVAIVLISITKSKCSELFVGEVPMMMNSYDGINNLQYASQSDNLKENPYRFPRQIYPVRPPYYPELGKPCQNSGQCGVLGSCGDGVCKAIPYNKTVFGMNV